MQNACRNIEISSSKIASIYEIYNNRILGFCIFTQNRQTMYTGLKHLHILLIALFVISVLIKAILLLINEDKFDAYRKKTKVPEMIITMLFLVTGIIMIGTKGFGGLHYFFHIKLTAIVVAIPLAIVGFKKKNKALSLLSAMIFVVSIGLALKAGSTMKEVHLDDLKNDPNYGKAMYEANCVACHGDGGAKQLDGAADLTQTSMTAAQVGYIIKDGIESMNPFLTLDSNEVKAISEYVVTLRK